VEASKEDSLAEGNVKKSSNVVTTQKAPTKLNPSLRSCHKNPKIPLLPVFTFLQERSSYTPARRGQHRSTGRALSTGKTGGSSAGRRPKTGRARAPLREAR